MTSALGELYKLARTRATLRRVVESSSIKQAEVPSFSPKPFSSLTARAEHVTNRMYKPEKNPLTIEEQRLLMKLKGGMSRSRARVVDASRNARNSVRATLAGTKLWE